MSRGPGYKEVDKDETDVTETDAAEDEVELDDDELALAKEMSAAGTDAEKAQDVLKKMKKKNLAEADQKINDLLTTNAQKLAESAAEAASITKGFSSKARTELLVDPSEVAFGASFHDALKSDQYMLHNLIARRPGLNH